MRHDPWHGLFAIQNLLVREAVQRRVHVHLQIVEAAIK